MNKIKRALISVYDKTGIVEFAKGLTELGVEIVSTGGTAKKLRQVGLDTVEISDYTGSPEMFEGRVKTLHPKIYAGLLAVRNNNQHLEQLQRQEIGFIDMVVVNLYPFEETMGKKGVSDEEIIENIDIGGPCMLRAAAKNYASVAVISDCARYKAILNELKSNNCRLTEKTLVSLACETFKLTQGYDSAIFSYFSSKSKEKKDEKNIFPKQLNLSLTKMRDLRYGENPHQKAAVYSFGKKDAGFLGAKQLHGKELSFNNILDLSSAIGLLKEFKKPASVVLKHNNACGAAADRFLHRAYRYAWGCDKLSAFGGIVGFNRKVDFNIARFISRSGFLECIIAPGFDKKALDLLTKKKNVRIMQLNQEYFSVKDKDFDMRSIFGVALVQEKDNLDTIRDSLKVVTKHKPTKHEMESLLFAWKVVKHIKSNAIVLAKGTKTVGIGAGQMSRVESVDIACKKAGKANTNNSVLASDAFFPKEDSINKSARAGIKAIIQPGGSIADEDIIKACNKHKIAMVFTGIRHFRH
ncbi:MAG: bifunctional phosphoribosylaminoimidazolecarboxamide formyltransferase/IMP cyclohydrolase [Candidatus Gygaella obscura]|nr:bifunctional phosphoribosylaminoimidazolecarboxamide formyltransferase/IMP cyclohydrolase [Candidatus Gygaella obscura]